MIYAWQYSHDDSEEEDCNESNEKLPEKKKNDSDFDGAQCVKCKDYFYLAEPNQPDKTFICRACKLNPWRNSPINPDD